MDLDHFHVPRSDPDPAHPSGNGPGTRSKDGLLDDGCQARGGRFTRGSENATKNMNDRQLTPQYTVALKLNSRRHKNKTLNPV